ncbi:MAG: outer membrane protein [Crocinitomicaceae bacterium]|jgi:outer membrane protein
MNKIIPIALMFFLTGSTWAQETFSLADAKAYTLTHNLTIKNSENDIKSAEQRFIEIRGMGLPQVDIIGGFSNFINLPITIVDASFINPNAAPGETISFRAGTKYTASGSIQATQLLFNGSYLIGLQAADYLTMLQENATQVTKEDAIFNVIQAYQLAAVATENLAFADSMVLTTERLIDKQSNYLELGLIKQEEMDQLNYSLLMSKDARLSAELQLKNAISLLKFSMGYPMKDNLAITDKADVLLRESALSTNTESVTQNLTYTMLEKQVTLSEFDVRNNQFANLPSLSTYFTHTYNAYRNEFNFFAKQPYYAQTVWGLQLNIPVFSGLSRHARTEQARVRLLNDQNSLKMMENTLTFQAEQARNNLAGAQSKHELQKENIALAQSIYDKAITKKEIGEGNSIIVTQKYNQLIMAQAQYTGALIELFNARLSLDKIYNNILPTE